MEKQMVKSQYKNPDTIINNLRAEVKRLKADKKTLEGGIANWNESCNEANKNLAKKIRELKKLQAEKGTSKKEGQTITTNELTKLADAHDELEELAGLFDDRIVENNRVKKVRPDMLVEQFIHAFMFYRKKCWKAQYIIGDILTKKSREQ